MRKWILAAVAALAVGQAEARTYTLTFIADNAPDFDWGYEAPKIVLDVPSLRNIDIFQDYDTHDGSPWTDDYIPPVVSLPVYPTGWSATIFTLKTDENSRIVSLDLYWDAYWEYQSFGARGWYGWSLLDDQMNFETTGHWDVSPVPVPASAPLMLGALGLLGLLRVPMSRRGLPTSAG